MTKGFNVRCLKCGQPDIKIHAVDVRTIFCAYCDEDFSTEELRERLDGWQELLGWIETAPELPE